MKTVLIVDDSALMRKMMHKIVTKNGYIVVGEAQNGKVALRLYRDLRPDIITMDFIMDEMSGLEALSNIIAFDPNAKVIMVSSMGQEVIVRDAIILGAKDFLLKPFTEEQVIKAFEKL